MKEALLLVSEVLEQKRVELGREFTPREQAAWIAGRLGLDGDRELEEAVYEVIAEATILFPPMVDPEALSAARRLAENYRIGLICNTGITPGGVNARILDGYGFKGLFQAAVFSDEFGYPKPDPRIFLHTAALLGVETGEAVHVGDNPAADVAGALGAGFGAVWLDRGPGNTDWSDRGRVDGRAEVITALKELPEALERLAARGEATEEERIWSERPPEGGADGPDPQWAPLTVVGAEYEADLIEGLLAGAGIAVQRRYKGFDSVLKVIMGPFRPVEILVPLRELEEARKLLP